MRPKIVWQELLEEARAAMLRKMLDTGFAELATADYNTFVRQSVPTTEAESLRRQNQMTGLGSKINAISNADNEAAKRPESAGRILAATREFCSRQILPATSHELDLFSANLSDFLAGLSRI